jgi:hypothetical protein
VDNAAVRILGIKLHLGDGTVVDWAVRGEMHPGQRTDVLDLPGAGERRVNRLVVFYETGLTRTERDRRRYDDWDREWDRDERPAQPEWHRDWSRHYGALSPVLTVWGQDLGPSRRDRWTTLGRSELDPRGERVVIDSHGSAPVDALVLGVDNTAVRILGVKIQFGNGTVSDWPIRREMYPGERTQALDLPGRGERRVIKIVVFYETGLTPAGHDRRSYDDWDQEWERDQPHTMDPEWGRDWARHYGAYRPVLTIWGVDIAEPHR